MPSFEENMGLIGEMLGQKLSGTYQTDTQKAMALQRHGAEVSAEVGHARQVREKLIENAVGVKQDPVTGELSVKEGYYTPEEAILAIRNYPKVQMEMIERQDKQTEMAGKKYNWMLDTINKSVSGVAKNAKGEQKEVLELGAIQRVKLAFKSVYGKDFTEFFGSELDPEKLYRQDMELRDVFKYINEATISKALAGIHERGKNVTSSDHVGYRTAYFMLPTDQREAWPPPDELKRDFSPKNVLEAQLDVKRKETEMTTGIQEEKEKRMMGLQEQKESRVRIAQEEKDKRMADYRTKRTINNLSIAARAVGVDLKKLEQGDITPEQAEKIADKYKEKFGANAFLNMLMQYGGMGAQGGGTGPVLQFDSEGNPITQ